MGIANIRALTYDKERAERSEATGDGTTVDFALPQRPVNARDWTSPAARDDLTLTVITVTVITVTDVSVKKERDHVAIEKSSCQ